MSESEQDRDQDIGIGDDGDGDGDSAGRIRRIVRVRGRVQGVGFRMDAADAAARLGVAGTVRNLLDGSVEADVEGSAEAVEAMLAHLREGPRSARVDGIDVRRGTPRGTGSFRITG
jgi:acylphosphatase